MKRYTKGSNQTITSFEHHQVLYPVGVNKDAYYLLIYHSYNVDTELSTQVAEVSKNFYGKDERLCKGSIEQCLILLRAIAEENNIK